MHRKTAENISRKLWQFFASPNPNAGVVAQLADVWMRTKGDIKAVLRTMAKLPEFYGVDAVGTRVKSPIEFEVNMERGFGTGIEAKKRVNPGAWNEPIQDPAWSLWGHCTYQMSLQGFNIFEPPSVAVGIGMKAGFRPTTLRCAPSKVCTAVGVRLARISGCRTDRLSG